MFLGKNATRCNRAQYGLANTHLTEAFPWRTGSAVPSIKPERVEQDSLHCCAEELDWAVAESRAIWVMLSSGSLALLEQRQNVRLFFFKLDPPRYELGVILFICCGFILIAWQGVLCAKGLPRRSVGWGGNWPGARPYVCAKVFASVALEQQQGAT